VRESGLIVLTLLIGIAGSAAAGPEDLEEIRGYLERGMLRTANLRLDEHLAAVPDSAEGRLLLAEIRLVEEDWDGAEAAAREALGLGEKSAREWLLWGRARFEQGLARMRKGESTDSTRAWFQQAELGFRKARELAPDHPDILWRMGQAREWQGFRGTAEQLYEAQIREHPGHPGGYRRLGELLARRANVAEGGAPAAAALRAKALEVLERGLEAAGEDAELGHLRAGVLEASGKIEAALTSWQRAILADPGFVAAWGRYEEQVHRVNELVPFAVEVLEKHPTSGEAARIAGEYAFSRQPFPGEREWSRFELVLDLVLPALEWNGDDEALYRLAFRSASKLIGETPRSAPNAKKAVGAFVRIHEAHVWSGDAANNLGFYYREVRQYGRSLAWYLKSCERAPENQDILNDTGLIYLYHRPRERANGLPYFEKVLALVLQGDQKPERGYWDALENLAKHYWEVDRRPELVVKYARMRYRTTEGVKPYNMSQVAAGFAEKAIKALGR
jgi:tetratricopeptide (TPR) repeat protein